MGRGWIQYDNSDITLAAAERIADELRASGEYDGVRIERKGKGYSGAGEYTDFARIYVDPKGAEVSPDDFAHLFSKRRADKKDSEQPGNSDQTSNSQNGLADSQLDVPEVPDEHDDEPMWPWEVGEVGDESKEAKTTWINLRRKANFDGGALARIVGQSLPRASVSWENLGGNVQGLVIEANGNTLIVSDVAGDVGIGTEDGEFFQTFAGLQFTERDMRDIAEIVVEVAASKLATRASREVTSVWNDGVTAVTLDPDRDPEEEEGNEYMVPGRVEVDVRVDDDEEKEARKLANDFTDPEFVTGAVLAQLEGLSEGESQDEVMAAILAQVEDLDNQTALSVLNDAMLQVSGESSYVVYRAINELKHFSSRKRASYQDDLDAAVEVVVEAIEDDDHDFQDAVDIALQSVDVDEVDLIADLAGRGVTAARKRLADAANNPSDPEDVEVGDEDDRPQWPVDEYGEVGDGASDAADVSGNTPSEGGPDQPSIKTPDKGELPAQAKRKQSQVVDEGWVEVFDAMPGEPGPDATRQAGNGDGGAAIWFTGTDYKWEAWSDSGATIAEGRADFDIEAEDAADAALRDYYGAEFGWTSSRKQAAPEQPGESNWISEDAWPHGGGTNRPEVENPTDMFDVEWVERPGETESLDALAKAADEDLFL